MCSKEELSTIIEYVEINSCLLNQHIVLAKSELKKPKGTTWYELQEVKEYALSITSWIHILDENLKDREKNESKN